MWQARVKGSLVLDPCGAEQSQQEAGGTLALMPTANKVPPSVVHNNCSTAAGFLCWLVGAL